MTPFDFISLYALRTQLAQSSNGGFHQGTSPFSFGAGHPASRPKSRADRRLLVGTCVDSEGVLLDHLLGIPARRHIAIIPHYTLAFSPHGRVKVRPTTARPTNAGRIIGGEDERSIAQLCHRPSHFSGR